MKKFFSILFFLCLVWAVSAFSEEIAIDSEVMSVDPELEFFVIKAGKDTGIEIGDGFIIHRDGEKIAEAYIIEVRPNVSAAEILNLENGKEIQEGDSILIVKKIEATYGEPPKIAKVEPAYITRPAIAEQGDVISINIHKDPKTVFTYARFVLTENGYSITSSNRAAGILLATKPIALSIMKELWADAFAAIDHKLVVSLDIKEEGDLSRLMVSSFKEHAQKGKHIKRAVTKKSKYYNGLIDLVSEIKKRSEY